MTDRGCVSEFQDTLHGVDGDDYSLGAQFGPGHVDAQLVNVSAQKREGQLQLLQTHSLSVKAKTEPLKRRTNVCLLQTSTCFSSSSQSKHVREK